MGKSDPNLLRLQEHFQIDVHFVSHNGAYISSPVSVHWIVKRSLSEEMPSELRREETVMGRSEA